MRVVGIRELKNRLSEFLRFVRRGERVLVTDRGRVVAELGPPQTKVVDQSPGLSALVREGRARPGSENDAAVYKKLPPVSECSSAALLEAERGSA